MDNHRSDFRLYGGKDPRLMPIYTIDEAAHILWLPTATLKAWTFGQYWHQEGRPRSFVPLIVAPESDEMMLSFTNLVEAHVLHAIRRVHRIKMSVVRESMSKIREEFETRHPLAEIDLYTEADREGSDRAPHGEKSVIVKYGSYVNMSKGKQIEMEEVVAVYLTRIEREEHKLARFFPFYNEPRIKGPGIGPQPKIVTVDPFVSFGRPVVTNTNIRTEAIAERFFAGDSVNELVSDFRLERNMIEAAIRFERPRSMADTVA